MRRHVLLAVAAIALLMLLVASFFGLQPIGHRWKSKPYIEPTCSEYDDVCNEGCRVRDSSPDCYGCCVKAKAECDASGDYLGNLKKCFVAKSAPSK